jgi:hypothetical protein
MGIFGHIHFAGAPDEAFWLSASRAMQAAASQLDIQLEVLYAERDPCRW